MRRERAAGKGNWENLDMRSSIAALVGILILTLRIGVAGAEGTRVPGSELEEHLLGAKMYLVSSRSGRDVVVTYGADGSYRIDVPSNGWFDAGKWWVSGDQYCYKRTKAEGCGSLYHLDGDNYIYENDRREEVHVTIRK